MSFFLLDWPSEYFIQTDIKYALHWRQAFIRSFFRQMAVSGFELISSKNFRFPTAGFRKCGTRVSVKSSFAKLCSIEQRRNVGEKSIDRNTRTMGR